MAQIEAWSGLPIEDFFMYLWANQDMIDKKIKALEANKNTNSHNQSRSHGR